MVNVQTWSNMNKDVRELFKNIKLTMNEWALDLPFTLLSRIPDGMGKGKITKEVLVTSLQDSQFILYRYEPETMVIKAMITGKFRCDKVYSFIYVSLFCVDYGMRGIGSELMRKLQKMVQDAQKIKTIQASILLQAIPNMDLLAVYERLGFVYQGYNKKYDMFINRPFVLKYNA